MRPKPGPRAVGAGLAEARYAHHHQLVVLLLQDVPAEPPFLHRAGLEVLDENVGLRDQPLQDLGTLGLPQVERGRLLVAALLQPGERVAALGDGAELAQGVADLRQLDLDDLGTELGQLRRAEGAGKKARHVDDANALQRLDGGMGAGVVPSAMIRVSVALATTCARQRCAASSPARVARDRRSGSR